MCDTKYYGQLLEIPKMNSKLTIAGQHLNTNCENLFPLPVGTHAFTSYPSTFLIVYLFAIKMGQLTSHKQWGSGS